MKLNVKGLIALVVLVFAYVLLIHDFAMLVLGYQFTWTGLITLGIVLVLGCEAEDYIRERINRG